MKVERWVYESRHFFLFFWLRLASIWLRMWSLWLLWYNCRRSWSISLNVNIAVLQVSISNDKVFDDNMSMWLTNVILLWTCLLSLLLVLWLTVTFDDIFYLPSSLLLSGAFHRWEAIGLILCTLGTILKESFISLLIIQNYFTCEFLRRVIFIDCWTLTRISFPLLFINAKLFLSKYTPLTVYLRCLLKILNSLFPFLWDCISTT